MPSERITENYFRQLVLNDTYYKDKKIILEEQISENPRIDKLLKNASKSGAGKGYPEFIVQYKDNPDFIIVVECKANHKYHQSTKRNKYKEYAVDGVTLYSSFLSKEFDVLSIAISGVSKKDLRISYFLQLKGITEPHKPKFKDDGFLSLEEYLKGYKTDEKKFNQDFQGLLKYSKTLNDKLHALKIPESDRSLLISGSLIALKNKAFCKGYKQHETPMSLARNLLNTIEDELTNVQNENIRNIMHSFYFITTHAILSERKHKLRDIIAEVDEKINNFIRTYKYFDTLGQFYIEFLRYANNDKGLGIVLTPPHITGLFCDIAQINQNSVVLDNCTGTGGFLISAMKRMVLDAGGEERKEKTIKEEQIIGIEFQHSIFSLTCSNMYVHGDGRSNLIKGSCFDDEAMGKAKNFKPNVGFLNPPYKATTDDIEELEFILNNLSMLQKSSLCIAIVPMSCALAQSGNRLLLKEKLLKNHTLEAVFSMPTELFHNSKVGVNTCVMVFKAKEKHPSKYKTYFGYWKDDGFTKRKTSGRADYDNQWGKIKESWVNTYLNKEEIAGHSVKQSVTAEDEWCVEAYIETDYSNLTKDKMEEIIRKYVIYSFNNFLIDDVSKKSLINKKLILNLDTWKYFSIDGLFDVIGSKSITKRDVIEYANGRYPYIVTSSANNGVKGFYNYYTEKGNVLTIDSATIGSCFYQKLNFSASDHVEKLIPKFKLNIYGAMFLTTIINLEQKRYCYGRKFAQKRIKATKIKLPVRNNGKLDLDYMENYIKALPYSVNL